MAPPERCTLPRWYYNAYADIYDALVQLVPRFPPNLHLLPVYNTDFSMFEAGERFSLYVFDLVFQFISILLLVFYFPDFQMDVCLSLTFGSSFVFPYFLFLVS